MKYIIAIVLIYLAWNLVGQKKLDYKPEEHEDEYVEYEEIDEND